MQKTMEARPTTRITETVKKQLNRYSGYVFIMPYFIFFTMLIILPTVINFLLSFTFYNVVEAQRLASTGLPTMSTSLPLTRYSFGLCSPIRLNTL